ncbi:MAG TPA: hypothetical protein DEQ78_06285 [Ruminococcaceae bacterium]|jgi:5'(3')-deoxyribonucleotidase|nr:hypothetical protein [Oscillospiraceae bacterium]HCE26869.1 hypothetical protein [Oscillospiraceae bacterium]
MKMIAFYNNKGGVGKTSTAINIAYTLSRRQNRILLVDFDGQCNSSRFFTDLANDECGCESAIVNAEEIEKEFFEHTSRLNSECFKNSLPNNLDDWEKAIINELEGVSEQVASGNIPVLQERTKIYIDMDGTIARFHDENLYLERMFEKGFFRDLKPFENAVAAIEKLVNDSTAEIYILSATLNSCSLDEKNQWLDKYLPNIDKDHRIFTSLNVPKSEAIGHQLTDKDILIDDYNKNLLEWEKAGGTSVKAKNNINHKGLHGELWKGEIVDVVKDDMYPTL